MTYRPDSGTKCLRGVSECWVGFVHPAQKVIVSKQLSYFLFPLRDAKYLFVLQKNMA
jgi:hypothetical protein